MKQLQIRATAYEYFQNGASESTAFEQLNSKFGPQCVDLQTLQKWHEKFKTSGPPSKVEIDAFTHTQRLYLGKIADSNRFQMSTSEFSIDGRYLIFFKKCEMFLVDLFHWKSIKLEINPPNQISTCGYYSDLIVKALPLSTNSMIVIAQFNGDFQIGVAKLDLSNFQYAIKSSVPTESLYAEFDLFRVPETTDSKARVLLVTQRSLNVRQYQTVTIGTDDQIQLSAPIVLPNNMKHIFYFNGHFYGYEKSPEFTINVNKLIRHSIATGEAVQLTISDEKNVKISSYFDFTGLTVVGRMVYTLQRKNRKYQLFSLNLNTMERKKTRFVFVDDVRMHSDGEKTLIVSTKNYKENWRRVYRFAVNQPDSLLDCAWLAILRRAEFDPELVSYAENKLPRNSRHKLLFPNQ
ncbi:hypothetical protein M3Y95_00388500 [Aphelenchoides besseyi]|nr:hypothetical protein M3Y95_00388500 [Aphelenchoides besseyi]